MLTTVLENRADEVIAPSVGPQPVRQFEFFNLVLRGSLRGHMVNKSKSREE